MTDVRRSFPASAEAIPEIRHLAVDWARRRGADDRDRHRIALAVTEAATNVVVHAYRDRAEPGTLAVELACDGAVLCVSVVDQGLGMQPRADSPGLGLGMPLIAQMADRLEVHTEETGGTEVCMRFEVASDGAAA